MKHKLALKCLNIEGSQIEDPPKFHNYWEKKKIMLGLRLKFHYKDNNVDLESWVERKINLMTFFHLCVGGDRY